MLLERLGAGWTQLAAVLVSAFAVCLVVIVSVLRTGKPFDDELLTGVRGREHLR